MTRRETYPNDWARLIGELVERDGWNQTKLAQKAGVGRNTIGRWIAGTSANVSAASIRLIAAAGDIDEQEAARAAIGAQKQLDAEDERALRIIREDPDASEELRERLRNHVKRMRDDHADERVRAIEMLLDEARSKA